MRPVGRSRALLLLRRCAGGHIGQECDQLGDVHVVAHGSRRSVGAVNVLGVSLGLILRLDAGVLGCQPIAGFLGAYAGKWHVEPWRRALRMDSVLSHFALT